MVIPSPHDPASAEIQKILKDAPRWKHDEIPNLDHDTAYDFVKFNWPTILPYIRTLEKTINSQKGTIGNLRKRNQELQSTQAGVGKRMATLEKEHAAMKEALEKMKSKIELPNTNWLSVVEHYEKISQEALSQVSDYPPPSQKTE